MVKLIVIIIYKVMNILKYGCIVKSNGPKIESRGTPDEVCVHVHVYK